MGAVAGVARRDVGRVGASPFGVPVHVENDANAAVLAEEQLRDTAEGDNLLYLLLDSGVGAGVLVHRELYRGRAGRSARPAISGCLPRTGRPEPRSRN